MTISCIYVKHRSLVESILDKHYAFENIDCIELDEEMKDILKDLKRDTRCVEVQCKKCDTGDDSHLTRIYFEHSQEVYTCMFNDVLKDRNRLSWSTIYNWGKPE